MDALLVIKALHIIAVVSWFAGLFYLPRLFVYHAENREEPAVHRLLCTMQQRLYRYIMQPAMGATLAFGILLAWMEWELVRDGVWFWLKLGCVGALLAIHFADGRFVRRFCSGEERRSARFFRIYNEIPTLLLIAIVMLVVLRPW